jgi:hypothetical protein
MWSGLSHAHSIFSLVGVAPPLAMDVPRALQMLGLCRTHCCATWFVEVEAVGRCVVASAVQLAEVKQMLSSSGTGEHRGCAVVPFVGTALPEAVLLASAHPLCCYSYCWLGAEGDMRRPGLEQRSGGGIQLGMKQGDRRWYMTDGVRAFAHRSHIMLLFSGDRVTF